MLTRPILASPQTERSTVLGKLARKLRDTSFPHSAWRVHHEGGRSSEETIRQLKTLAGQQASLVFDQGIFEDLEDPAAVIAFCGRHIPRAVLSFDESAAKTHPLTRDDFELRLLLEGASFRALEPADGEFWAYEITFTRAQGDGESR